MMLVLIYGCHQTQLLCEFCAKKIRVPFSRKMTHRTDKFSACKITDILYLCSGN